MNKSHQTVRSKTAEFNKYVGANLRRQDAGEQILYDGDGNWVTLFPDIQVYSAHLEKNERGRWQIRIIGVAPKNHYMLQSVPANIQCWINYGGEVVFGEVKYEPFSQQNHLPVASTSFLCPVKHADSLLKASTVRVALGTDFRLRDPKWLTVGMPQSSKARCCAICVSPVSQPFDDFSLVAEFVDHHVQGGVRRFDFYLGNVSREMELFFLNLRSRSGDRIRLHKWNVESDSPLVIEYGRLAALQDCSYSARSTCEYVISAELEEFVVPKQQSSIAKALFNAEMKYSPESIQGFVLQTVFFCTEYPHNEHFLGQLRLLQRALLWNFRDATSWRYNVRSKFITKANSSIYAGSHFVWDNAMQQSFIDLDESVLALHHYSSCCGLKRPALLSTSSAEVLSQSTLVFDNSALRFANSTNTSLNAIAYINYIYDQPAS